MSDGRYVKKKWATSLLETTYILLKVSSFFSLSRKVDDGSETSGSAHQQAEEDALAAGDVTIFLVVGKEIHTISSTRVAATFWSGMRRVGMGRVIFGRMRVFAAVINVGFAKIRILSFKSSAVAVLGLLVAVSQADALERRFRHGDGLIDHGGCCSRMESNVCQTLDKSSKCL